MYEHHARKRFGQNFLRDPGIIQRIIESIAPGKNEHFCEIGPGKGAMTDFIALHCKKLDGIELDRYLVLFLKKRFDSNKKVVIHSGDALKFDYYGLMQDDQKIRIVGNLPYNISTSLLFYLLKNRMVIQDMHFMLQKEVVDRLIADTNNKNYGRLGIMMQYYCQVKKLFLVPSSAFSPSPSVQSAFIRCTPHTILPYPCHNVSVLEAIVRMAFSERRKKLRNSLRRVLVSKDYTILQLDEMKRAENISLQEYVKIANYCSKRKTPLLCQEGCA